MHALPSSHLGATPPTQAPPEQVSLVVHGLASSHTLAVLLCTQPLTPSHRSLVHGLPSSQPPGWPAHWPFWQKSLLVQPLPSSHLPGVALFLQPPPAPESQVSSVQGLLSSQLLAEPVQVPVAQVSAWVQALPSSQPPVTGLYAQPVSSQLSSVQAFLSLQTLALPPWHWPSTQVWPLLHASSLHGPVAYSYLQPLAGSQTSSVHAFKSSQFLALPVQTPATQVSLDVHLLPSSHGETVGTWAQALAIGSQLSVVQGFLSSHARSSVLPSQLSSKPLQVSAAAGAALQVPRPLAEQVRLPVQLPKVLELPQSVPRPSFLARESQSHCRSSFLHCLTIAPEEFFTSAHL